MLDLRTFLAENEADILRISEPLSIKHEITALQYVLWEQKRFPIVLVENPKLENGQISPFQAVTNLTASREVTAKALNLTNHKNVAVEIAKKSSQRIDPIIIDNYAAPCKEIILKGEDANLESFPIFTQHEADAGKYLTAAHATTYDLETGVDNTAIQRVWVKSKNRFGYFPYLASHNRQNMLKFWECGESAPIAFWIGHHPAISIGTQAKLGYPESHWATAGGLIGEAVRLVNTELFGDKIKVPADAEIILEGFVPPNLLEKEGGFGEYTSFMGEETMSPVFELHCVTHRKNAIYHDYGSGLPDALVPDNMMIEAKLFQIARQISPEIKNVYVPISGRRFHAYISVGDVSSEIAREILHATLNFRRVKMVVLVNNDIDIFDEEQILWAIATRTQMNRDALILDDLEGSALDPSLPEGVSQTAKMGIDATWKNVAKPLRNKVPNEVLEKMRRFVNS